MALTESLLGKIATWKKYVVEMAPHMEALKPLIIVERALRKEIVEALWPAVEGNEGTRYENYEGMRLKANVKIDRIVDEAAYQANDRRMWDAGINPAVVFKIERKLSLTAYKALTQAQQRIVEECFEKKPASPELELVPAKAAK